MLKEIVIKSEKSGLPDGVLYLTDDLQLLESLRDKGEKVAAILTEENYDRDFSGIPYAVEKIEELGQDDFERLYRRLAGLPWNIMETNRCRVREMTVEDVDRLYEIYEDSSITRYMENLYADREKERKYAEDYRRYIYEFYGYGIWIIEEKETGTIIGRAGIEPKEEDVELGYMIALPWQRKGYAFEVCGAILEYVWKEVGCGRIVSQVQPDNISSIGLLKKLRFHKSEESGSEGMEKYVIKRPI